MLCFAIGAAAAALVHLLFKRWTLFDELWPLPLLYPCLICFVSCALWLVFFR
jgi:hypothetical protein